MHQTLYGVILDFFATYVFPSADVASVNLPIGDATLSLADWLSHTATIVVLVLLAVVAGKAICWLFSCVGHAFGWLR